MKKFSNRLFTLAGLALSFGLGTPAHAEDWKVVGTFGWFGVGKAYEIDKGHIYWVGEFSGTFFNDKGKGSLFDKAAVKCPAYNDIDAIKKKNSYAGYCIITDTDGDQAYLKWQGGGDTKVGPGTWEYTGGTGKYEDISGSDYTFVGFNQVNWADGTASGYATSKSLTTMHEARSVKSGVLPGAPPQRIISGVNAGTREQIECKCCRPC